MSIRSIEFSESLITGDYKKAKSNPFYDTASFKRKLQIQIGSICPELGKMIDKKFAIKRSDSRKEE